jgi:hypothetical protein
MGIGNWKRQERISVLKVPFYAKHIALKCPETINWGTQFVCSK